jgi:hypothetical protein
VVGLDKPLQASDSLYAHHAAGSGVVVIFSKLGGSVQDRQSCRIHHYKGRQGRGSRKWLPVKVCDDGRRSLRMQLLAAAFDGREIHKGFAYPALLPRCPGNRKP